ncbi:MAG: glycosyltransferase [Planctomycetes bacterium]|nr:glycosyltransferase [Planctomycetota bacterium]
MFLWPLLPRYTKKIKKLQAKGVKIHSVPMTRAINPLVDIYCLLAITWILISGNFDIVHTHCSKAGILGRLAATVAGVSIKIHSSHCFAFLRCGNRLKRKIYLLLERLAAKVTTKFIAISSHDARTAQKYKIIPHDKISLVNNALYIDESPAKKPCHILAPTKPSNNKPVAATICRLVEYKGIFTFLQAAKLSKSDCRFVIAGVGDLQPSIKNYINANKLSKKITLAGYVSDMNKFYSICDIVVLCSSMEGQPFVLLEAMRAGCAIVATNVPGNRELLRDNRGLLVGNSPTQIAEGIDRLICDPKLRNELARNAFDYLYAEHKIQDQIKKLAKIYLAEITQRKWEYEVASCIKTKI